MKPTATAILLVLALAAGGVAHRISEHDSRTTEARRSVPDAKRPQPGRNQPTHGTVMMVDELLAAIKGGDRLTLIIHLDEKLASLPADEFPRMLRELRRRDVTRSSEELQNALFEYWAEADADGLLQCAEQRGYDIKFESVIGLCFLYNSGAAVAAIHRWHAKGATAKSLQNIWEKALAPLCSNDPVKALRLAGQHEVLSLETLPSCLFGAVEKWAQMDPRGAVSFTAAHPKLLANALTGWAANEPAEAVAWINSQPLETRSALPLELVLRQFALKHPQDAASFIDIKDKQIFRDALAGGMANLSPPDAARWISTVPDAERAELAGHLSSSMAYRDPAAAAAFLALIPREWLTDRRNEVLDHWAVMDRWGFRDPVAAAKWIQEGHVPAAAADRWLPNVVNHWLNVDRMAALDFIDSLPSSEVKGQLALEASRIMQDGDMESARDFALALPDPAMRVGACCRILDTRFLDDSAQARADGWIAGISDPAIRQEMQAEAEKRWPDPRKEEARRAAVKAALQ